MTCLVSMLCHYSAHIVWERTYNNTMVTSKVLKAGLKPYVLKRILNNMP